MINVNGLRLHVEDHGSGRPVLLLHGFPDSSYLWRHQTAPLTDAGFRVVAPDQRGFGRSDRPEGTEHYALPSVIGDMVALLDAMEIDRADVVGHDWGAVVAWSLAMFFPQRVGRLAVISVGHPSCPSFRSYEQVRRSWYFLLFEHEGLAEEYLSSTGFAGLKAWLGGHGDVDRYVEDMSRPGALTAALNWYRANVPSARLVQPIPELPKVAADTLAVWSTGDVYLGEEQVVESESLVDGRWKYERIAGASHWIPLDAPDRLSELLIDWFTQQSA